MPRKYLYAGLTAIGIVVLALLASWLVLAGAGDRPGCYLAPGEYVALEHVIQTWVTVPSQSDRDVFLYVLNLSGVQKDGIQYAYPRINDSLRVVFINGVIYGDAGCHGGAIRAQGIDDIPFGQDNVTIRRIDPDGTVSLDYNGRKITLGPGESWCRVNLTDVVVPIDGTPVGVRINETDRFWNYGLIKK
jgi:hypothetical protein